MATCPCQCKNSCTIKSLRVCEFKAGNKCWFETTRECKFKTGSSCHFTTSYKCVFDTGKNCEFHVKGIATQTFKTYDDKSFVVDYERKPTKKYVLNKEVIKKSICQWLIFIDILLILIEWLMGNKKLKRSKYHV